MSAAAVSAAVVVVHAAAVKWDAITSAHISFHSHDTRTAILNSCITAARPLKLNHVDFFFSFPTNDSTI